MPTYAYKCSSCGCEFEKLTSIAGKDQVTCKECSGPVKRVFTTFNILGGKPAPSGGCMASGNCPQQGSGG